MPDAVIADAAVRDALARHESEIASLSGELLDRYEEATFVYRLCERIGTVLGENAIARLVLEDVARVLGAGAGSIWLRSDDGAWGEVGSWPEERPGGGDILAPGLREAITAGRPWLRERAAATEPAAAVPVPGAADAAIGCIVLAARASRRPYRAGDLKLLGAVAALMSAFVRNHRLSEKARRADARQREDDIARQIHRGLLPRDEPRVEGLDVSGGFRAAELVGGDFYGYVRATGDSLGVAMADVSGHGVGAALYMATAKGAIQSEGRRIVSPADLLARANEVLLEDFSGTDVFATAVFIRFIPREGRLVFASGGHNPPLLVSRSGDATWLPSDGPALGIIPDAVYEDRSMPFGAGDLLIAYTDGLVEARDAGGRFFGTDRLLSVARACAGGSAAGIRDRIFEVLDAHLGAGAPSDDVTLVVVRGTPQHRRAEAA